MRNPFPMPVALSVFRAIYVAFIVTASLATLLHGKQPGLPSHVGVPTILAGVEIVAALSFLFRRSEIPACLVLLVVYAIAMMISVTFGDWSLRFVYYGATAIFIVIAARNLDEFDDRLMRPG